MTTSAPRTVIPFPFSADFEAPKETPRPAGETLQVTAGELVALLDQARQEGVALAMQARGTDVTGEAEATLARLGAALDDIQMLTRQVEDISRRGCSPEVHAAIARVAQSVLDGQGDLFARTRDITEETP